MKPPEYNKKYWMKVCNDENIQYLILGIFWMISPPLLRMFSLTFLIYIYTNNIFLFILKYIKI